MALVEYNKNKHLVTITLNRPEKRNALNGQLMTDLGKAWLRYEQDEDAWVAILAAEGKDFSAGADMELLVGMADGDAAFNGWLQHIYSDPFFTWSLEKPTIAAIQGNCLGAGFDMILRADLRVAAENARFQVTEVLRGIPLLLLDNLSFAISAEIVSGSPLSGRRAAEVGLVNRAVPENALLEAATEMADELLERPPLAVRHALKILREIKRCGSPVPGDLDYEKMNQVQRMLQKSEDFSESLAAFAEKRQPRYRGR